MLSKNDLKMIARLTQKKYRSELNKFLAEGGRLCEEAIKSDWKVERVIYCPSFLQSLRARQALQLASERNVAIDEVPSEVFVSLSDTMHSQGLLAVVEKRPLASDPVERMRGVPRCMWVGIEKLHDPGNMGTILRTADWLGVDGIVIGKECVEIYNPKVVRASMGSIFHLPIFEVDDFAGVMRRFQTFSAVLYGADQAGDFSYSMLRYAPKKVLLLGDEVDGLSPEVGAIIQHRVSIPRRGGGESLNVAIAAAILLAEMSR
ncbi:MAG: RNA methyltransferase [candidate division KSB1 bacterium]|nr:RNA methyltransferase [candidate division KSB1 bacterium]MDZ7369310.1 RNA methyltransferase [candidate division KSB1 bacterium]MDZ7407355.1 RNA methyltransferase [candidate division KSB1 bacterium]